MTENKTALRTIPQAGFADELQDEASPTMIEVTRLNGTPMILNSDLIKIAESSPDTMLTLIHGEKLIVRESCTQIVEKVLAYRAQLLAAVAVATGESCQLRHVVALASLNPETQSEGSVTV